MLKKLGFARVRPEWQPRLLPPPRWPQDHGAASPGRDLAVPLVRAILADIRLSPDGFLAVRLSRTPSARVCLREMRAEKSRNSAGLGFVRFSARVRPAAPGPPKAGVAMRNSTLFCRCAYRDFFGNPFRCRLAVRQIRLACTRPGAIRFARRRRRRPAVAAWVSPWPSTSNLSMPPSPSGARDPAIRDHEVALRALGVTQRWLFGSLAAMPAAGAISTC